MERGAARKHTGVGRELQPLPGPAPATWAALTEVKSAMGSMAAGRTRDGEPGGALPAPASASQTSVHLV